MTAAKTSEVFDDLFAEHAQLFFSIFGIRMQTDRGRSHSQGNLIPESFKSIEGKMFPLKRSLYLTNLSPGTCQ